MLMLYRSRQLPVSKLNRITLTHGGCRWRCSHICLMQLVAWLTGDELHHAWPVGVNHDVCKRFQIINDLAEHDHRQRLKFIAPALVGFNPSEAEIRAALIRLNLVHKHELRLTHPSMKHMLARLRTVDDAIRFVRIVREQEQESPFTPEDEQFLTDVEHGRIKSTLTAMVVGGALGVLSVVLLALI